MEKAARLLGVILPEAVFASAAPPSRTSVARFEWFEYRGDDAGGTVLSTERAGGFVGAVFGHYAHGEEESRQ
jgi:hypothetical protein